MMSRENGVMWDLRRTYTLCLIGTSPHVKIPRKRYCFELSVDCLSLLKVVINESSCGFDSYHVPTTCIPVRMPAAPEYRVQIRVHLLVQHAARNCRTNYFNSTADHD